MKFINSALVMLCLCLCISGCSGSIRGTVFIDENKNDILDMEEKGAPYAKLIVTRDGTKHAEGYTTEAGTFAVRNTRRGVYCFDVDTKIVEANISKLGVSKAIKIMPSSPLTTPGLTETPCPDADRDGVCDSDEEDKTETGEDDNEEPSQTQPARWSASGYCKKIIERYAEINIPLRIDYSGTVSGAGEATKKTCEVGELCAVRINLPDGCRMKPLYLPSELKLPGEVQEGIEYNPELNQVIFDHVPTGENKAMKAETATTAPTVLSRIVVVDLKLEGVAEDVPIGTTEVQVKPSALCGQDVVSLGSISISLVHEIKAALYLNLKDTPAIGHIVPFEVVVDNKGGAPMKGVELTINIPQETQLKAVDSDCRNLGSRALCTISAVEGRGESKKALSIELPPSLKSDTTFKIEASLTAQGLKTPVYAEPIEFVLFLEKS